MSKTALEEEGAIKILEIGLYVGQNAKGGGGGKVSRLSLQFGCAMVKTQKWGECH